MQIVMCLIYLMLNERRVKNILTNFNPKNNLCKLPNLHFKFIGLLYQHTLVLLLIANLNCKQLLNYSALQILKCLVE